MDLKVRLGWEQGEDWGEKKSGNSSGTLPYCISSSIVVLAHQRINEAIDFARGGEYK